jgi:hypothetical protein
MHYSCVRGRLSLAGAREQQTNGNHCDKSHVDHVKVSQMAVSVPGEDRGILTAPGVTIARLCGLCRDDPPARGNAKSAEREGQAPADHFRQAGTDTRRIEDPHHDQHESNRKRNGADSTAHGTNQALRFLRYRHLAPG